MKKILFSLFLLIGLMLPAKADILPYYTDSIPQRAIGVYQADSKITVYEKPDEKGKVLLEVFWNKDFYSNKEVSPGNLFLAYVPRKELGLLTVMDENPDWIEITYDKKSPQRGWVKKSDKFRFMNWRTFYGLYGRKYGVYYMKDVNERSKNIFSSKEDDAQKLGTIKLPQKIKMTAIKGNWLLVNVFDFDKLHKIGWIRWRDTKGQIFLFPEIK